jgi:hypothetical protein
MSDNTITLKIEQYGETTVHVDRAEYEQAKADGTVDQLLDMHLSDMEHDTTITEPDGTSFDPFAPAAQ